MLRFHMTLFPDAKIYKNLFFFLCTTLYLDASHAVNSHISEYFQNNRDRIYSMYAPLAQKQQQLSAFCKEEQTNLKKKFYQFAEGILQENVSLQTTIQDHLHKILYNETRGIFPFRGKGGPAIEMLFTKCPLFFNERPHLFEISIPSLESAKTALSTLLEKNPLLPLFQEIWESYLLVTLSPMQLPSIKEQQNNNHQFLMEKAKHTPYTMAILANLLLQIQAKKNVKFWIETLAFGNPQAVNSANSLQQKPDTTLYQNVTNTLGLIWSELNEQLQSLLELEIPIHLKDKHLSPDQPVDSIRILTPKIIRDLSNALQEQQAKFLKFKKATQQPQTATKQESFRIALETCEKNMVEISKKIQTKTLEHLNLKIQGAFENSMVFGPKFLTHLGITLNQNKSVKQLMAIYRHQVHMSLQEDNADPYLKEASQAWEIYVYYNWDYLNTASYHKRTPTNLNSPETQATVMAVLMSKLALRQVFEKARNALRTEMDANSFEKALLFEENKRPSLNDVLNRLTYLEVCLGKLAQTKQAILTFNGL